MPRQRFDGEVMALSEVLKQKWFYIYCSIPLIVWILTSGILQANFHDGKARAIYTTYDTPHHCQYVCSARFTLSHFLISFGFHEELKEMRMLKPNHQVNECCWLVGLIEWRKLRQATIQLQLISIKGRPLINFISKHFNWMDILAAFLWTKKHRRTKKNKIKNELQDI